MELLWLFLVFVLTCVLKERRILNLINFSAVTAAPNQFLVSSDNVRTVISLCIICVGAVKIFHTLTLVPAATQAVKQLQTQHC